MNYESIILELMTRVQKLEEEVKMLNVDTNITKKDEKKTRTKVTPEMIKTCYSYAKSKDDRDVAILASEISEKTGMNIDTANMNIKAIRGMLAGIDSKRRVSAKTWDLCLGWIYDDFGELGLEKALYSAETHIKYLNSINDPARKNIEICEKYKQKLIRE